MLMLFLVLLSIIQLVEVGRIPTYTEHPIAYWFGTMIGNSLVIILFLGVVKLAIWIFS